MKFRKKRKIILISFLVFILLIIPIIVSPLGINDYKGGSKIDNLTTIVDPKNETSWLEFRAYNSSKTNAEFQMIQDYVVDNSHLVESSTPEGKEELDAMLKDIEKGIKDADFTQLWLAYSLRTMYANINLRILTGQNRYELAEKDRENLESLYKKSEVVDSSDQVIMENKNGEYIRLGGIKIIDKLRPLVVTVYEKFEKSEEINND